MTVAPDMFGHEAPEAVEKARPLAEALAARGNADSQARNEDGQFFPTPRDAVVGLIRKEAYLRDPRRLHDPQCGEGHLCGVLAEMGHRVTGADLVLRGPSPTDWQRADRSVDFLKINPGSIEADGIVMNPPFGAAHGHIRQALRTHIEYLACMVPANFFFTRKGYQLKEETRPARFYACCWRVDFTGGGSNMFNVGWAIWRPQRPPRDCVFDGIPKPRSLQLEEMI